MTWYLIFVELFLTFESLSREKPEVKNVGPPAEGDLYLEVDGPMGPWMGFLTHAPILVGILVGMTLLMSFWYLPFTAFICTMIPASVRL